MKRVKIVVSVVGIYLLSWVIDVVAFNKRGYSILSWRSTLIGVIVLPKEIYSQPIVTIPLEKGVYEYSCDFSNRWQGNYSILIRQKEMIDEIVHFYCSFSVDISIFKGDGTRCYHKKVLPQNQYWGVESINSGVVLDISPNFAIDHYNVRDDVPLDIPLHINMKFSQEIDKFISPTNHIQVCIVKGIDM